MKQKSIEVLENESKKALRLRIADICVGAAGYNFDDENEWSTAQMLGRMVPALELRFGNEENRHLFKTNNLEHYENIDSITDFLWENDVRA